MKWKYASVLAFIFVTGGCTTSRPVAQDLTQNYWYSGPENPQCYNVITIGGGLKTKCDAPAATVAAVTTR